MRKSKLKFFALPLCLSALFVGCSKGTKIPEEHVKEENVSVQSLNQLLKPEKQSISLVSYLTRFNGEVLGVYGDICLVKNTDKDTMNNVIETFELYNPAKDTKILTLKHTYPDGAYDKTNNKDYYGNTWKQPTEMKAEIVKYPVPHLKVETYTNTRISDEFLDKELLLEKANEKEIYDNNGYISSVKVDFYGLDGTKLAGYDGSVEVTELGYAGNSAVATFGNVVAEIDLETGKVLNTWKADKKQRMTGFNFTGDGYGVYLNQSYGQYNAVETYTVQGKLLNRYTYESEYYYSFMLNNGNVMVQYYTETQGADCDIVMDETKYFVKTILLDTLSGNATQVETDYCFHQVMNAEVFKEYVEDKDITVTDNVYNVGVAVEMNGKDVDTQETKLVFMNSALEISFVEKYEHPEILDKDNEMLLLDNGQYAVKLDDGRFASYVILNSNFETVRYLPVGSQVTEEFFILPSGIYDLNMEQRHAFNEGTELLGVLGNSVLLREAYEYSNGWRISLVHKQSSSYSESFVSQSYADAEVVEKTDEYVLLLKKEGGYVLLNTEGSAVLSSTNVPSITRFDNGSYLVCVEVPSTGETYNYIWETKTIQDGGDE